MMATNYVECGRAMRRGGTCGLVKHHKGRCSSVTFTCTQCGGRFRGTPFSGGLCFLDMKMRAKTAELKRRFR